jgi:DNA-directed RNA polymerase subunit RPC12/RpoP
MHCPNCNGEMTVMTLEGHQGKSVVIDRCVPCQAFWFDKFESLQLAPAATLNLLQWIGEQKPAGPASFEKAMRCPRCESHLLPTQDMQRNTRFCYFRCTNAHGRFIRFFEFLREKDFIRPLSTQQIAELRKHIRMVNCSNCGAPVDLEKGAACSHCGSPLSMLDMDQPQRLIAQLKEAAAPKPIDPALGFELMKAKRDMNRLFGEVGSDPIWWKDVASSDLVQACLGSVARWLKTN